MWSIFVIISVLCIVFAVVMVLFCVACGSDKVKLDKDLLEAINQVTEESFGDMLLSYEWDEETSTYYIAITMEGFNNNQKIKSYDLDTDMNGITKNFNDSFKVDCCLGVYDYDTKQDLIFVSVNGEEVKP